MLASLMSILILNWKALAPLESVRFFIIFFIMLLFVMMMLYFLPDGNLLNTNWYHVVDTASTGGGFMIGFALGLVMMPKVRRVADYVNSWEKTCMKIGALLTFIYFVILLPIFFTKVAYPKDWYQ